MDYETYPREVKFRYLVRKRLSIVAGFVSEQAASDYASSIDGTVLKAPENPRCAGRLPLHSPREEELIRERIRQGVPLRRVAAEFKCSVGYVHKLKSEQPL